MIQRYFSIFSSYFVSLALNVPNAVNIKYVKTADKVDDKDIVVQYVDIDFNTKSVKNDSNRNSGTNIHLANKPSLKLEIKLIDHTSGFVID